MSVDAAKLAERAARTDWSAPWKQIAAALKLAHSDESGDRISFRDTDACVWDFYLDGAELDFANAEIAAFQFDDPDAVTSDEYEAKYATFAAAFKEARVAIAGRLGKPDFEGAFGDAGFPDDADADRVALWPAPRAALMLQLRSNDFDGPIEVGLAVQPHGA